MRCGLASASTSASSIPKISTTSCVFYTTSADIIEHFGGYIAQYLDDGLLAYFGYPQAYEDAAARAVRAALGTVEATKAMQNRWARDTSTSIEACIGIHTGLVVTDAVERAGQSTPLAIGETPHVVAQLQQLAAPSSVAITATTARLVQGLFTCLPLPDQTLTVGGPVDLSGAQRRSTQSRWDVVLRSGYHGGTKEELVCSRSAGSPSHPGKSSRSGEPGIGKSIEALRHQWHQTCVGRRFAVRRTISKVPFIP